MKIKKLLLCSLMFLTFDAFSIPYVVIRMPNYLYETNFFCNFGLLPMTKIPPRTAEKVIYLPNVDTKKIYAPFYTCDFYDKENDVLYAIINIEFNDKGEPTKIIPQEISNKAVKTQIVTPITAIMSSKIKYPAHVY
jgi:hypothetical protein